MKATKKKAKRKPTKAAQKTSAIDAAAKVLARAKGPMNCKTLIERMAAQGLWASPNGKTPHATLYVLLTKEINAKGTEARFVKAGPGLFARK